MWRIFLIPFFLVLLFSGCNAGVQSRPEELNNKDALKGGSNNSTYTNFTKSYEGSIGGKYDILMTLVNKGGIVAGSYLYTQHGVSIKLAGSIDNSGNIELQGFEESGNVCDIFRGSVAGATFAGVWSKPDGKKQMEFSVSETSNTESDFKKQNHEIEQIIDGSYKSEDNKLIVHETANGELQFEIQGYVSENCAGNGLTGVAAPGAIPGFKSDTQTLSTWLYEDGDCTIGFAYNTSGHILVIEGDCSMYRCARYSNYSWSGNYSK